MELYNKRLKKILSLFLHKQEQITGNHIALSLGVSDRTVRNDIKQLNQILLENGAEIISEIGQGYYLNVTRQGLFQKFMEQINLKESKKKGSTILPSDPEERVYYIVKKLLLNALTDEVKVDAFDLEDELFISTSTLNKDLRTIEKQIKKYDLKISNTKKYGLRIIGDEAKLRYCISEYVFNHPDRKMDNDNKFYREIFSEDEIKGMNTILLDCIEHHQLQLTDIAYRNLHVHSLIMLKRYANAKKIQYDSKEIQLFSSSKEFECASEIIEKMNRFFHINLETEVYYLTQHLISSQRKIINDTEEEYEFKEVIQRILRKIEENTGIDLSDDKQLINGLAMHLSAALQRLRFDMNIRNEFLDSVKNSYPFAFELAVMTGEILEEKYHLKAIENEIGFLAIHFGAALERKGIKQDVNKKKVIIICIAGVATAMLLKEKIKHNFKDKIEVVKSCSANELTEEMIEQVDIILTTVDLPKFHSNKIKKINLFLKDSDMEELGEYIEESDGHHTKIQFEKIFRQELFYTDIDLHSKEEVLNFMTNSMLEKGYITETIKKSIFKREEMATTELGSLVAIPHALLNETQEALVSVLVLKKPILWDREKVQVVLLLNIPKSKYDLWEEVFKILYQYLISQSGVTKLMKNHSYMNFINDLKTQQYKEYKSARRGI